MNSNDEKQVPMLRPQTSPETTSSDRRAKSASWRSAIAALILVASTMTTVAHAGQPCDARSVTTSEVINGIGLAAQTARALESRGVQAGVIARMGQDLSKWRQRYSHIGLVYRANPTGSAVTWRVVHKLNDCGSDTANIYRQGLAEFFADAPYDWEAAVVPLSGEAAKKLLAVLKDNKRVIRLHEPRYSMVAYPWATKYQQSNQWVLETMAMTVEPRIWQRALAQSWLRFQGYEPDRVRIGTLSRLGARLTKANIEFDDHPTQLRFSGRIDTTTADSALRWLEHSGYGGPRIVVRLRRAQQPGYRAR
ncbi:MAG: DUF2145 domain-containing protein [Burkholderiaceae bacterium]